MANEVLGKCTCPLCGYVQDLKLTSRANPKPYMTCEDCHVQIFARGAKSARLLKNLLLKKLDSLINKTGLESNPLNDPRFVENAAPAPAPAPVNKPKAIKPAALAAPDPVPPVEAQPKPEKTIFDFFS